MIYLLTQTIDDSAKKFPEKVAFKCGNHSITYLELHRKSNQLANVLLDRGVDKGDRVGVFMNRCLETSLAIYGIMKAGAAYVPLDPLAPLERIRFQLDDCGIEKIVTTPNQTKKINDILVNSSAIETVIGSAPITNVNTVSWDEVFASNSRAPEVNILEKDLAYIMYTSGSTGVPKGIMHTHRSGLSYALLSADLYQINEHDVVGNHAPLYFDISTLGYFTSPLVGATTSIVPEAYTRMPSSLAQLIAKDRVSVWYSVPLAIIQMMQQGVLELNDFSDLRWVLFGGEVFPTKHLNTTMKLLPNCKFSNVYGPAELNQCTYYHLSSPPKSDRPLPLGKVWKNTEELILNSFDEVTKVEEQGELVVRSATMMVGYWNQPELTKKSFYIREMESGFKKVYYRTGDLVSRNKDGELEFGGRKDRQVKVRGYRVELEEVATSILKMVEVNEAAVFHVIENDIVQIRACVILREPIEVPKIHAFLEKLIPKYAHPQHIELVEELPRSATGKADFKELQKKAQKKIDEGNNN